MFILSWFSFLVFFPFLFVTSQNLFFLFFLSAPWWSVSVCQSAFLDLMGRLIHMDLCVFCCVYETLFGLWRLPINLLMPSGSKAGHQRFLCHISSDSHTKHTHTFIVKHATAKDQSLSYAFCPCCFICFSFSVWSPVGMFFSRLFMVIWETDSVLCR